MSIILFLIVLAVLVLVHEWGHFFAAKKLGIRVDEFGLGFPPKLYGKKVGETEYTLNAIPFGGFVRIFGENPDDASVNGPDKARSFVHKPAWAKIIVLSAGVLMNFVFAWILISIAFMFGVAASRDDYGVRYPDNFQSTGITITIVNPGTPASLSDIKPGDRIVSLSRVGAEPISIDTDDTEAVQSVRDYIDLSRGATTTFTLMRGEDMITRDVRSLPNIVPDRYAIGIAMDNVGTLALPPHIALYEGGSLTIHMMGQVIVGLYTLIVGALNGTADMTAVTGPVGIAGLVGDAASLGMTYLLMFTALISINLGIINLVPFPALDGGRIFFILVEKIIRRPISHRVQNIANATGFAILLLLMVAITFKDIIALWMR